MAKKGAVTPAQQLRAGRVALAAGVAGALLGTPALLMGKTAPALIGWSLAWLGGWSGFGQVGPALRLMPLVKYLAMGASLLPVVQLPVLAWGLWRTLIGLRDAEETERIERTHAERSQREVQRDTAPSAATKPPAAAPVEISVARAIACITRVGVGDAAEGTLLSAAGPQEAVMRACKGVFGVMYAVEVEQGFAFVTRRQMEAAHLGIDQLHALALRNLEARVQRKEPGLKVSSKKSLNLLKLDGMFDASIVLLDELWEGPLLKLVPNGAMVALPSREICAFCDLQAAEGVGALRQLAAEVTAAKSPGLLSPQLLTRQHGRWRVL